ncbi:NAD-dependent epimerase/dehydratase family protein [Neolewinella aurantiaca]|uniref:NAD-dependent epimerase/dehydratase family protein n=1 Tax=Neolewinella aurantiaca TaxID=2602767 RepID=A0A5C7FWX4_9BACT|nr:NAD-dependent epimerase/dehydratase family protein [Neolewinella aurantiaca]TXF90940.1 NAD-dependent epimerase/dehydratase family protein [Neolewinella aurantiaca]
MILVTGSAGFIGHALVNVLAAAGEEVVGIDNLNDYYDPRLKWARLAEAGIDQAAVEADGEAISKRFPNYRFRRLALEDKAGMEKLFNDFSFTRVCNLAAQAGVRYSLTNPQAYVESNVTGFVNILENCKANKIDHLVYASSSSVYGLNDKVPFAETDPVEQPASLYAATKRSNELMAHTYSHLYNLPTTGLRFFTVYGPWGRPDMAYSLFSDAILSGRPIKVFNHGKMSRDFTYVDDIVEGVRRVLLNPRPAQTGVPNRIYNIGNGKPVSLLGFIETMEKHLEIVAEKEYLGMQPGDVEKTFADTTALEQDYNYRAATDLDKGIGAFVDWYRSYYKV